MTLKKLRQRAAGVGVKIEAERDDCGWGYWLVGTGWKDGNFCTTHDEIAEALRQIEQERRNN